MRTACEVFVPSRSSRYWGTQDRLLKDFKFLFDNQPFSTYLFNSNDEWSVAELIQVSWLKPTETANRS